jgi:hypothetical protein
LQRWALQKAGAHIVARSEQILHLPQGSISAAGSIQKGGALLRRQFERFLQQIANLLPAFPCHVCQTLLFLRCSHNRVCFVPRTLETREVDGRNPQMNLVAIGARSHLLRFFPIERVHIRGAGIAKKQR